METFIKLHSKRLATREKCIQLRESDQRVDSFAKKKKKKKSTTHHCLGSRMGSWGHVEGKIGGGTECETITLMESTHSRSDSHDSEWHFGQKYINPYITNNPCVDTSERQSNRPLFAFYARVWHGAAISATIGIWMEIFLSSMQITVPSESIGTARQILYFSLYVEDQKTHTRWRIRISA